MSRIVTTHYRYKRPPRKRKAIALEVPAIVTIPAKKLRRVSMRINTSSDAAIETTSVQEKAPPPAHADRKSAIVTARRRKHALAHLLDLTVEESNRRADLADEMLREMKRRIAEKVRK